MNRLVLLGLVFAIGAMSADPKWIWIANEEPAPRNRFTYFRKVVNLNAIPANAELLLAADSNAHLWVNGQVLRRKVTRYHEAKITAAVVDARPALRVGKNTVVVLHHNWGPITTFQRDANRHAGLWVGGTWLQSDASWKALTAPEFLRHDKQIVGLNANHDARIRYPVIVDGRKALPGDIHSLEFDDSMWTNALAVNDGPWPATPARVEIPGQREFAVYPPKIVAAGALTPAQPLSDDPLSMARGIRTATYMPDTTMSNEARRQFDGQPTTIKARAGESRYITFDFQQPVHGFPFLALADAPPGTTIDIGYGEIAYSQYSGERHVDRNGWLNPEGIVGAGYADRYVTRAGVQSIEFPDERTARWMTVHFHFASDGEVVLRGAGIVRSQYPVTSTGSFSCGNDLLEQIVRLCLIHAEITMSDAYVDTPGREDGEWIEDARVRALISSRWFGDERLRRLVLRHHAESSRNDGGFHSFPPSNYPAYPANYDWAVQWTAMLYDDYMWSGKTDLVEQYWGLLKSYWEKVLAHVDENGIWRTNRVFADIRVGVHPANGKQSSGIVTPFMVERLRWSAILARATSHSAEAQQWTTAADRMHRAYRRYHLIPANGSIPVHAGDRLDPDNLATERGFSQAAQVNAMLAGLLSDSEARALFKYVFPAPDGTPPAGVARWNNPTFGYRSLRALSGIGMTARAVAHLIERYSPYLPGNARNRVAGELQGPWGGPLPEYWISREDLNLKDGEKDKAQPEDETGSHGWGATPLLWMHDTLLGVRIVEPGGGKLVIAPDAGGLPYVAGRTRTPKGQVWVDWQPSRGTLEVEIPAGVQADITLQDTRPGSGTYRLMGPARKVFTANAPAR